MIDILLTGIGGQGTVLAAKILATAAANKGWKVRTAETIGMSQRGGSVVSHVRIADCGEEIFAPLITPGCADVIIAFEPAEGARVLPYIAKDGLLVSATTPVRPPSEALSGKSYDAQDIFLGIESAFDEACSNDELARRPRLAAVDDSRIIESMHGNRKVLNTVLLAASISQNFAPITTEDLKNAISMCVKPDYVELNLNAIDETLKRMREK